MKAFSTFSGIGGFEQGFRQSGKKIEWIGYSEIDKYAIQIYNNHFNHKNYGDIRKIDTATLPDFDLLVGGFPCQDFSIAGKRRGFGYSRGTLFFELARLLRDKRPQYFIFENVKGLLSHDEGNTFKVIISTLDELGYVGEWQVLNSKNFGVPQNRERIFIVGHLRESSGRKILPFNKGNKEPINQSIQQGVTNPLTRRNASGHNRRGTYIRQIINKERIRRLTPTECERLQGFPDGWTRGVADTQRYHCLGNAVTTNVIEYLAKKLFL